ncbi:hybrid non-ribosomal peptide synthetase/type I polyketide synthase [Aquimarina mytili]|uniref:Amino acid adenylation domain-containing protein n=1 Tax=Aquimarina mytili TaxID=874423 RepID=A0A936ZV27_9FLAO|nr:hybrid non-ribosomal peptide synthetase/type I polyketide synthase [Aquimarina mytili]MBL0685922.1 amino acid adenylation domain-containing protein [Aquimarina mytili]
MKKYNGVEIAIVGMSGQFPGAKDIDQFWDNLKNGVESIGFFTDEELKEEDEEIETINNPSYVKANAYLEDKQYFDSEFFGYTPSEAKLMDPQARLFHENCWKALEDAGYDITTNTDKIGLFAGASSNVNWLTYALLSNMDNKVNNFNAFHLRDVSFLCSRVSYLLNLQGPSVYINTACSTSLVAIQRACMSLLLRECKMAIAGGITIKNHSKKGYFYEEGMIESSDGHCRTFDADADGTIGGEGVGVIVLKRLSDAIKDGDNIYAVIKGSGVNNDGDNKIAYTAPSIDGQSQAIHKAMRMGKVEPQSISYVEAHGTATKLGDPIEVEALTHSFGKSDEKYCAIGSVKSNIGHLDIAAGVAGLIKTAMSLKDKLIPPSLHFKTPNPKINFSESPFYVNTALTKWKNDKYPLRAGVSSFGIGGTNAHVILEEAPEMISSPDSRDYQVLTFSAKTTTALERNLQRFSEFIKENNELKLSDVAYTLQTGRASLGYRKTIVCNEKEDIAEALSNLKIQHVDKYLSKKERPSIVFMFSGQGSQYVNMCLDLYNNETAFRENLDTCFEVLGRFTDKDLKSILFSENETEINNTENAQPLLFSIEYALAQLLISWGIQPEAMVGHSIGEYVAACLSGVFSLEDALFLVLNRGELMQKASKGTMLSVSISEEKLQPYLSQNDRISLAAVNSSDLCVLSGTHEEIAKIKAVLEHKEFSCKELRTSHAFHSHMMDEILEEFRAILDKIELSSPQKPFYSNLTGELVSDNQVTNSEYWVKHLRGTVKFSKCIENLAKKQQTLFIEVGPGRVLSSLVRSNPARNKNQGIVNLVRHSSEETNDQRYLLSSIGSIWEYGVEPDWKTLYQDETRLKVSLPTYSFDKVAYPTNVDAYKMMTEISGATNANNASMYYEPSWKKASVPKIDTTQSENKVNILFLDELGIGDALQTKLEKNSDTVIGIKKADNFSIDTSGTYHLNPENKENIEQLFSDLHQKGIHPDRVLYAWPISDGKNEPSLQYKIEETSFYTLFNTIKSLHSNFDLEEKELIVLTNDLHTIVGNEEGNSEEGMQLGLLKVIAQEYSGILTGHIDISLHSKNKEKDVERLYQEILYKEQGKSVALRNANRWVQTYESINVDNIKPESGFKNNGTYLITGGLGNLGYTLSKYLLEKFKAKVILTGRTELPKRNEWKKIVNTGEANEYLKTRIERYQELEKLGGEIEYYSCDIIDKSDFEKLVENIEKTEFIDGVIHAAGVIHGNSINLIKHLQKEDFEDQFFAKTIGIKVLDEVFKDKNLDFCLVISSLSSILGGLGFAAYASANSFMDYFVKEKLSSGNLENWLCVNFDGLNFSDNSSDDASLDVGEIYEAIERVLSLKDLQQIVVSKTDLQLRLNDWVKRNSEETLEESEASYIDTSLQDTNVSLNSLEEGLIKLWEDFFGKSVEIEDNFFEIGGDSLKALTMLRRIHKTFNVELSIKEFFDCSTVRLVSQCISTKKTELEKPSKNYVSIPKVEKSEYYHLSSVQRRLYFLHEYAKDSLAYNLPQIVKLEGDLDTAHFEAVFEKLLQRHESFRTSFSLINGEPMQKIEERTDFKITQFKAGLDEIPKIINDFIRPFDLNESPLIRVGLVQINESEHILMVDMHHIITDGISQGILISDFMKLYNNESLPPLHFQYKDYAHWQHTEEQQERISNQKEFWLQQFSDDIMPFDLPTDFIRPLESSNKGESVWITLEEKEIDGLAKLADKERATNYMVLLAVFNILLSKLSNQEDITVGSPVAGRQHADFDNVIGMFVNTLSIRNYPKGNYTFREFLAEVKQRAIACFDNQDYPYEELVEALKIDREKGRNPLFDTMFEYQLSTEETQLKIPDLELTVFNGVDEKILNVSKFDLLLSAVENGDHLTLKLEYSYDLFRRETVERFIAYYKKIINQIINNPDCKLSDVKLLDDKEENKLLKLLNNTKKKYQKENTILEHFEKQVQDVPNQIAIQYNGIDLTYKELQSKSNQIYGYLNEEKNVKAGDTVGILLDRDEYLIPAILGTLKTGAAFVPIDIKLPEERIQTIVESANLKTVLTCNKSPLIASFPDIVNLDEVTQDLASFEKQYISHSVKNTDVAYIIYTSGSTGKPKGVMIEHQSLINYINWSAKAYVNNEKSTFALFTSISFDLTITSIFTPLFTGNKMVLYPENENEILVEKVFLDKEVDVIKLTPSHLKIIKNSTCSSLNTTPKKLIVGGENFETSLAKSIDEQFSNQMIQYNEYGPTEATVGCMIYEFNSKEQTNSVPIGKPIDNMQVYVLDKYLNLVPKGVEGELYLSGDGISKGYWGNADLTSQRFLINPFAKGKKMYQTGDIVTQLEDGNLIYKGRIDDQVKIRGFRIELGEIEAQIEAYEHVKEVYVIPKEIQGEQTLFAYYVASQELDASELKTHLAKSLPEYMIPANCIQLEEMPLTQNGKLDKKALPDTAINNDYISASTTLEKNLVEVFAKVLKLDEESISTNKSFFELGGNSIKVILLISAIRKLNAVKLKLKDVFDNPSIQKLAQVIEKATVQKESVIPSIDKKEYYPTSPAQERMYYQQSLDTQDLGWNISTALEISDESSTEKLEATFQKLIDRHECLRTSFVLIEDGVVQKVNEDVRFELQQLEENQFDRVEEAFSSFVRSFDLSEASLFRCALLKRKQAPDLLFIDVHHIVCDGISLDILIKDFTALYFEQNLDPIATRYVDYASWQRNSKHKIEKQEGFWKNMLKGKLPRLELLTRKDRNEVGTFYVDVDRLDITGSLYTDIKEKTQQAKVSNFMFLLSVYYILLSKISGKSDVIIGTDVLGRTHTSLKNLVGTFVNILPLRTDVNATLSYKQFLEEVKTTVLEAYDNQDFQFDQMVDIVDKEERVVRNPIVDVHFAVSDTVEGDEELETLKFNPILINSDTRTSPYEFKIEVSESNHQMHIDFIYCKELYDTEMIRVLKDYFSNILNTILEDDTTQIQDIMLEKQVMDFSFEF